MKNSFRSYWAKTFLSTLNSLFARSATTTTKTRWTARQPKINLSNITISSVVFTSLWLVIRTLFSLFHLWHLF